MLIFNILDLFHNFNTQSYDILNMHQHLLRYFLCYIHLFYFHNTSRRLPDAKHPDGIPPGCDI